MKKLRRRGSYISMENLLVDANEEEDENAERRVKPKISETDINNIKVDHEGITVEPIFVLSQAFDKVKAVGSSTVLVGIRNQKKISICNLGDSGFLLIRFRNGEAYAARRSKEQ